MVRCLKYGAVAILLVLAVGSVPVLGLPTSEDGSATNATTQMTNTEHTDPTVEIGCNESRVKVAAPDDYKYGLTVTVVDVNESGTSTSTSSQAPYSGNTTVEYDGTGVVYAFVTDESTGESVTSVSAQCETLPGTNATNATNATDQPSITIDCNGSVAFAAPEDVSYTVRVTSVDVSSTGTSSSSVTRTATGNTTVAAEGGLIVAVASVPSADDPVSAVRDCERSDDADDTATKDPCTEE